MTGPAKISDQTEKHSNQKEPVLTLSGDAQTGVFIKGDHDGSLAQTMKQVLESCHETISAAELCALQHVLSETAVVGKISKIICFEEHKDQHETH